MNGSGLTVPTYGVTVGLRGLVAQLITGFGISFVLENCDDSSSIESCSQGRKSHQSHRYATIAAVTSATVVAEQSVRQPVRRGVSGEITPGLILG